MDNSGLGESVRAVEPVVPDIHRAQDREDAACRTPCYPQGMSTLRAAKRQGEVYIPSFRQHDYSKGMLWRIRLANIIWICRMRA